MAHRCSSQVPIEVWLTGVAHRWRGQARARTRVSDQRVERAAVAELRQVVLHQDDQVLGALVARPLHREAALVLVARANGGGHFGSKHGRLTARQPAREFYPEVHTRR